MVIDSIGKVTKTSPIIVFFCEIHGMCFCLLYILPDILEYKYNTNPVNFYTSKQREITYQNPQTLLGALIVVPRSWSSMYCPDSSIPLYNQNSRRLKPISLGILSFETHSLNKYWLVCFSSINLSDDSEWHTCYNKVLLHEHYTTLNV